MKIQFFAIFLMAILTISFIPLVDAHENPCPEYSEPQKVFASIHKLDWYCHQVWYGEEFAEQKELIENLQSENSRLKNDINSIWGELHLTNLGLEKMFQWIKGFATI